MCNIIIKKSKEENSEFIVTTRQQQFYEAKPRKIVAFGRGLGFYCPKSQNIITLLYRRRLRLSIMPGF